MNTPTFPRLALSCAIALTLAACGTSDAPVAPPQPPAPAVPPGEVFALTVSNRLISFNRDTPGTVRTNMAITGLQGGESLVGIDFRPSDGMLYGVASSGRIYTINTGTGAATLKSTLVADAADTSAPYTALAGEQFGVDFNPAADRLRIVGSGGQSLRINVDTGATTTDGGINGAAANTSITASAYTNSFAGTASTTLFGLDTVGDMVYTQNPPNNGTLAAGVGLGIDVSAANGFDIDAASNLGYAIFTIGGARGLYTINLTATTKAATPVGAVGVDEDLRGLALRPARAPMVHGLTDDNRLVSFAPSTPNTVSAAVSITGLAAAERVLGIDMRPKDGMLYAVTSLGKIYTVDPASGAATLKSSLMADAADTTAPYTAIMGNAFAVDFNPVADRLRVIGDTGQSLRINADTGATTTDGAINAATAMPIVTGAAYTNSIAGATSTMLLDIDTRGNLLAVQNPPNDGTLATIGALGVDVEGDVAMDIAGGANGLVLAALRTSAGGPSSLYRIDLTTGAATLVNGAANPAQSAIGNGAVGLRDIAIMLR